MATADGTWAYRARFGDSYGRTYFRRFGPGVASSIGLGTYLGAPTDAVDDQYRETTTLGVASGLNHLDTASNYRCGRSESAVGDVLATSDVARESVVVASKAGFLPFDRARPDDPARYVRERFVESGIVDPEHLVRGTHCLQPSYLDWAIDRSLQQLGVERIDTYYLHNPETQLAAVSRETLFDRLTDAFETLERRRATGEIGCYGIATWNALRVPPDDDEFLDLQAVMAAAERAADRVGADENGFEAVQLPFNVQMAGAFTVAAHGSERVSALRFAHRESLAVVASAGLAQGALADDDAIPPGVAAELAGDTPAQRAINFARSAPAVRAVLVGTTSPAHLRENLAAGTFDPMGADQFDRLFA